MSLNRCHRAQPFGQAVASGVFYGGGVCPGGRTNQSAWALGWGGSDSTKTLRGPIHNQGPNTSIYATVMDENSRYKIFRSENLERN